MSRYFFRTFDNGQVTEDPDGVAFENTAEMRKAAIRTLPLMALDALPDGETHEFAIEVFEASGAIVFRASLSFCSEWVDTPDRH